MIPWRVKNLFSEHFPLAYHLVANRGLNANSSRYWDRRLAETWDAPNRNWPAKVDALSKVLDHGMSVIDIGCGTGSILQGLRERGFKKIHGLEQSEYAIDRLAEQGLSITKGDFHHMPFATGTFDAAIASEILEHVIRRRRLLNGLTRIVKPSGMILIFVPDNYLGPVDEPEHVSKYDASSLRKFLSRFVFVEAINSVSEPHSGARSLMAICRNGVAVKYPAKPRSYGVAARQGSTGSVSGSVPTKLTTGRPNESAHL